MDLEELHRVFRSRKTLSFLTITDCILQSLGFNAETIEAAVMEGVVHQFEEATPETMGYCIIEALAEVQDVYMALAFDDAESPLVSIRGYGMLVGDQITLRGERASPAIIATDTSSLAAPQRQSLFRSCSDVVKPCEVTLYGVLEKDYRGVRLRTVHAILAQ